MNGGMDGEPLISVIIPCFNQGRFLPRAVRSAIEQSYRPLEVIVVDDGSTDDTPLVARGFGDPVRYIHQANAGPSSARNRGVAAARGRHIAFLDADDWWHPAFLAVLHDALIAHGGRGVAYCRHALVDTSGARLPRAPLNAPVGPDPLARLLLANPLTADAVLVDAATLRQAGPFDERLRGHEDWDLWLRLAARGIRFVFVPRVLAYYRQHGSGLHANHQLMDSSRLAVLGGIAPYCARPPYAPLLRTAEARGLAASAAHLVQSGDCSAGLARFRDAVDRAPTALFGAPYLLVFLLEALRERGAGSAVGLVLRALPPRLGARERRALGGLVYACWGIVALRQRAWSALPAAFLAALRMAPGLPGNRELAAWAWQTARRRLQGIAR